MIDFNTNFVLDDVVVVEVRGALNEMSRAYFFQCMADLLNDGAKHVIVDCSGLGVINSSGMSALLSSRKRAQRHGGKIYLTHLNSTIASALEYTRLGGFFAIFATTDEVVETFRTHSENSDTVSAS